jgi:hypothetical protein
LFRAAINSWLEKVCLEFEPEFMRALERDDPKALRLAFMRAIGRTKRLCDGAPCLFYHSFASIMLKKRRARINLRKSSRDIIISIEGKSVFMEFREEKRILLMKPSISKRRLKESLLPADTRLVSYIVSFSGFDCQVSKTSDTPITVHRAGKGPFIR